MALTPIMLVAMQGLLNNNALAINTDFINEIEKYVEQPIVLKYREILGGNFYYKEDRTDTPITGILSQIKTIFKPHEQVTDVYIGSNCQTNSKYFTEYLLDWAYMILAIHRDFPDQVNPNGKFIQTFQNLIGYVEQMNEVVNSAVNGGDVGASTFTSMDEITTGNLTAVTSRPDIFGEDLSNTGKLLHFPELNFYGTPQGLTLALMRTNGLRLLKVELLQVGIVADELADALIDNKIDMIPEVQKILYNVYKDVTGKKLTDILLMFNMKTQGIKTLADLLDTYKIFPNSIEYLLTIVNSNIIPLNDAPNIPSVLENIIPENIARINTNFRNTLYQIKGILTTNAKKLAEQFKTIELNTGLSAVNNFDRALPDGVVSRLQPELPENEDTLLASSGLLVSADGLPPGISNHVAHGQNDNGSFYVTDGVGTPTGRTHIDTLQALNEYNRLLIKTGLDTEIINKLDEIIDTSWSRDAEYRTDNDEPDRDDYPLGSQGDADWLADWTVWNDDRIDYINVEVDELLYGKYDSNNILIEDGLQQLVDKLPKAEVNFDSSLLQISVEKRTLTDVLDWPEDDGGLCGGMKRQMSTAAVKKVVIGFTSTLHAMSEKTDLHDVVEVLEKLSIDNQDGQAIISSMREGRNLKKLDDVGVKTDTRINPAPKNPKPGEIKPANT